MNKIIFKIGDKVVYKPYEGCRQNDISDYGIIEEIIDNFTYKVRFGFNSIHGTRLGTYNYSKLFKK